MVVGQVGSNNNRKFQCGTIQLFSFLLFILFFSLGNIFLSHQIILFDEESKSGSGSENKKKPTNGNVNHEHKLRQQRSHEQYGKNNKHIDNNSVHRVMTNTSNNDNNTTKRMHDIPKDGFAGCLLLKGDSDRLAEWLAYHWLVLPLKYLVVAVDPTGTTSPEKILNLWKTSGMGMEIDMWNDVDYGHWLNEALDEKHKHRARQKLFLSECEKYHKKKGRSWLAVIDPDEYITFNTINDNDPKEEGIDVPEKFLEPQYVEEMNSIRKNLGYVLDQQQTVFSFINENHDKDPWKTEPCHLMPRLFFSAVESSDDIISKANVQQYGLDPMNFSTLRYFHHAKRGRFEFNNYGKVIVDLTRIKKKEIIYDMYSIHRPNHISCLKPVKPYFDGILRVHHYLGSWEQYFARSDVRRTRERFHKKAVVDEGTDFQLQYWLQKFVEIVGAEKARLLLNSAGVIEKGSSRLLDQLDFVNVEDTMNKKHGKRVNFRYLYDEDGSVVDIQDNKGQSLPFKIEKPSKDIINI